MKEDDKIGDTTYQVHASVSVKLSRSYFQDSKFMDLFHAFTPVASSSRRRVREKDYEQI